MLLVLVVGTPLLGHASPKPTYVWNQLREGLRYTSFSIAVEGDQRTTVHAFAIDPHRFRIDVVTAGSSETTGASIATLGARHHALVAINGGFFTPGYRSIGLLVQNGKTINRLHQTSWWSIFTLDGATPSIKRPQDFAVTSTMRMALQAGPRLVVDGRIPRLKGGRTARSAIGITQGGHVVLVATEGAGLTMRELAERMTWSRWQGGLECDHAMNLDGGGSTQLWAKVGKFNLTLPGFSTITNGIAVFPY
ncbi:MAG: phosphodiester glycosidase family protein [Deltaproteobacteria bacterium]|nr:phosphodiester glycosidase family protein [Deltaproteobacteria bacterium]